MSIKIDSQRKLFPHPMPTPIHVPPQDASRSREAISPTKRGQSRTFLRHPPAVIPSRLVDRHSHPKLCARQIDPIRPNDSNRSPIAISGDRLHVYPAMQQRLQAGCRSEGIARSADTTLAAVPRNLGRIDAQ